jgi:hypothetical protein
MCKQQDAMKRVREAACLLSATCLGLDYNLLSDPHTVDCLPQTKEDFTALLKRLSEIE